MNKKRTVTIPDNSKEKYTKTYVPHIYASMTIPAYFLVSQWYRFRPRTTWPTLIPLGTVHSGDIFVNNTLRTFGTRVCAVHLSRFLCTPVRILTVSGQTSTELMPRTMFLSLLVRSIRPEPAPRRNTRSMGHPQLMSTKSWWNIKRVISMKCLNDDAVVETKGLRALVTRTQRRGFDVYWYHSSLHTFNRNEGRTR